MIVPYYSHIFICQVPLKKNNPKELTKYPVSLVSNEDFRSLGVNDNLWSIAHIHLFITFKENQKCIKTSLHNSFYFYSIPYVFLSCFLTMS